MENFIDTYMNLTLKSMFMLKYINYLTDKKYIHVPKIDKGPQNVGRIVEFILKSDDNCYINIRALKSAVGRWRGQASKKKFITGYKIDQRKESINLMRPTGYGSIQENPAKRFEVPVWMYQGKISLIQKNRPFSLSCYR